MTKIVRQLRNGQITIPSEFRRELQVDEQSYWQITLADGELHVRPVAVQPSNRSTWLKDLYDLFQPVRDEARGYTEEEINAAIDEAVKAVREKHAHGRL